jgi:curved DNA-binding protein CbpA
MRTHYDTLGVRSDADDEALNKAYRKAAKAHHPDLNAGDPDAPRRFSQIASAFKILRDPQQRAAYDRSLDRQRQQRRLRCARIVIVIANAIAAAVLIAVLAGGHAPVGPAPSPSRMASKVENNGFPRRGVMVGEQGPQRTETTGEDEPRRALERGLPPGAAGQQLDTVEREAARRQQDQHPRAAEFEPQTAEREAAPRRERDERRQARKARRLAAIAEAAKSAAPATPTPSGAVQRTQTASSAASPPGLGPVDIAAARYLRDFDFKNVETRLVGRASWSPFQESVISDQESVIRSPWTFFRPDY